MSILKKEKSCSIFSSKTYESPIEIQDSDIINLRLFDKTGRGGNAILVNK